MTDTAPAIRELDAETKSDKPEKAEAPFWKFLLKLALVVLIFRSFIFSPFNIPSESMLPRLWNGDYLLAAKWPYGYTSASLPFGAPLIPGRIFPSEPERGDEKKNHFASNNNTHVRGGICASAIRRVFTWIIKTVLGTNKSVGRTVIARLTVNVKNAFFALLASAILKADVGHTIGI